MLRNALRFAALMLAVVYSATFFAVWLWKQYSVVGIVNVMTAVAVIGLIASFPMLGPTGLGWARARIQDPRRFEAGPERLSNEVRGVVLLVVSLLWLGTAVLVHKAFG
jgi:hypothetical protein